MVKGRKVLIVVPARGGSRRLPNKNLLPLHGKPLLAHALGAALASRHRDRVIVSTDSPKIARTARKYGADVPFLRPAALATDLAPLVPTLQHAARYCIGAGFHPDIVVKVSPTSPLVLPEDIDEAIETLLRTRTTSCFSACAISERPEWMYGIRRGRPFLFLGKEEALRTRSQDLPELYRTNGAVGVVTTDVLMKQNRLYGDRPSMFIMPRERSIDIDERIDFTFAEALLGRGSKPKRATRASGARRKRGS